MKQVMDKIQKRTGWAGLLIAAVFGWAAVSCEEQDLNRTFEGPYFVRFTDSTLTVKESQSLPVAIRVHNAGPVLTEAIIVNYTVSGSAREGRDYAIVGTKGRVVIPANKSFGEISVKLINNANNILESQSLTFALTNVQPTSLQVGFGKEGALGRKLTLTIQDECLFSGLYTGTGRVRNQNVSVRDVEITSTNCKEYTLGNWNVGLDNFIVFGQSTLFGFQATKPTLRFVDNGDNTLTVPSQSNAEFGSSDTLQGNGAWNPRNRQITLNLQAKLRLQFRRGTTITFRDTTYLFTQTYIPQ